MECLHEIYRVCQKEQETCKTLSAFRRQRRPNSNTVGRRRLAPTGKERSQLDPERLIELDCGKQARSKDCHKNSKALK